MSKETYFKKIQQFDSQYAPATFTQYESTRTGMRVVVVDREGPKVNGYFTLATEIHDDSGAPHTLEHLCFMGSRSYHYKGILDKLANRAYSTTNAWTATDHTAYTLDTAGWDGFAQILPVYLEHVILPTLTDAGCYTEVWHIDGEGNDAGVVYSEMQGVQNDQGELMDLKSKRLLYPDGNGFRSETGGMMEELRVLTAQRIRQFHKDMYQPKNLCLVLVGSIEHAQLLQILDTFEGTILNDIPDPNARFSRPWVESKPTPPLNHTSRETVEFPEEDESMGEIMISFFGPPLSDNLLGAALDVLLRYVAGSSASVLDNTIVEKEQLASAVVYSTEDRPDVLVQFGLNSVATERLEEVEARFFKILRDTAAKPLDMKYLHDCIGLGRRQIKFSAESSARFFTSPIITDFLFGNRDGTSLERDLRNLQDYDVLESWTDDKWRHWLRTWFSEAQHVTVFGKPSLALAEKIKTDEKNRTESRIKELGDAGLKRLAAKLDQAKAENDKRIPDEILEKFEVPSTDSIHFIETITARSGSARKKEPLKNPIQQIIDEEQSDLPLFIHFEHIQSNFAILDMLISTEKIPIHLRPMLVVYLEIFFSSPLIRDGQRLEFEDVIKEIEGFTVGYGLEAGQSLGKSEALAVKLQVEVGDYNKAVQWLKELAFSTVFDLERIATTTARLLAEIPDEKRSGNSMKDAVNEMIIAAPASITRARSTLVRAVFLKWVKRMLLKDPDKVIAQLEEIRAALWQPCNFRVLVIADVKKLHNPVTTWSQFVDGLDNEKPLAPLETRLERLSDLGRKPRNTAYIVPLPTIDSSFAVALASGPSSYDDPVVPALLVAASYLNAVEGPLWTAVRGTGLAYGTSISQHRDAGQISLLIYRSPDSYKAYSASKQVVQDYASGKRPIERLDLEGAISSIVLDFANGEASMASAAEVSFVRQVIRGQEQDWPRKMLEKVRKVTVEEVQQAMKALILPIFDPATSILVATCAPIMQDGLVKGFTEAGLKPQVKALSDFQDDYGFKVDDLGDDEDEDEDENEDEDGEEEADGEDDDIDDEDEKK